MEPNKIELENLNKIFEYEKISREIDSCNDIDYLKNMLKSYIKLYFRTQETILNIEKM